MIVEWSGHVGVTSQGASKTELADLTQRSNEIVFYLLFLHLEVKLTDKPLHLELEYNIFLHYIVQSVLEATDLKAI